MCRFKSCCIDQLSREEGTEEGKLYAHMQKGYYNSVYVYNIKWPVLVYMRVDYVFDSRFSD